jgi:predicted type IV restriction endonuclease
VDFIDELRLLANRIATTKGMISTEEATKNSMIMPMIKLLGYDPFNPMEVTPELVADVGTKKGEKVDYAVLRDGKPIMLFECKKAGGDLSINHAGQLFRYFHVTAARFGVLTNGMVYKFFTDLEQPNKMDEKPFFEFNILEFRDRDVEELKKFTKATFDVDTILTTANELKYTRSIQNKLAEWVTEPSDDFVRLVSADLIGSRRFSPILKDQFTELTRRAFEQLIGARINERLKGAMTSESVSVASVAPAAAPAASQSKKDDAPANAQLADQGRPVVDTTSEEVEGFHSIRSILREVVPPKRIFMRDAQSYCAVLLDDNNRKPIARLRFNNTQRLKLGLFGPSKDEEVVDISCVDDIFNFSDRLKSTVVAMLETDDPVQK